MNAIFPVAISERTLGKTCAVRAEMTIAQLSGGAQHFFKYKCPRLRWADADVEKRFAPQPFLTRRVLSIPVGIWVQISCIWWAGCSGN